MLIIREAEELRGLKGDLGQGPAAGKLVFREGVVQVMENQGSTRGSSAVDGRESPSSVGEMIHSCQLIPQTSLVLRTVPQRLGIGCKCAGVNKIMRAHKSEEESIQHVGKDEKYQI